MQVGGSWLIGLGNVGMYDGNAVFWLFDRKMLLSGNLSELCEVGSSLGFFKILYEVVPLGRILGIYFV